MSSMYFLAFSCLVLLGAIQRKYESIRRQWIMDNKENRAEKMEVQVKLNKYRARRIRVNS